MIDETYTARDHEFRENDDYAKAKYDITLRWLSAKSGVRRRLVNVGCGAGLFNGFAHASGFDVEACEPDPGAHAIAERSAPAGTKVHLGGLFDAPLSGIADVVVMHDVLEHIEDEGRAVEQLAALVAPGGRLVISVPAMPSLFGLHDERLGHYRRYSKRTLRAALESHFRIERMRYFGFVFIPVTFWFSRFRRKPYPTGTATGPSLVGRMFRLVCSIEARVPMPLGTSLICEAVPKDEPSRTNRIEQ
ncbi:MAG TPA: class I SAM-dependent methyltransferase [Acidimicrobiales bacterium]